MRKDTLEALKDSIAHHKYAQNDREGEELGWTSCALCKMFIAGTQGIRCARSIDGTIELCPVHEKTKQASCYGSPYYPYGNGDINGSPDLEECRLDKDISDKIFEEMEQDEIAFLESLLPKEDQQKGENNEQ